MCCHLQLFIAVNPDFLNIVQPVNAKHKNKSDAEGWLQLGLSSDFFFLCVSSNLVHRVYVPDQFIIIISTCCIYLQNLIPYQVPEIHLLRFIFPGCIGEDFQKFREMELWDACILVPKVFDSRA